MLILGMFKKGDIVRCVECTSDISISHTILGDLYIVTKITTQTYYERDTYYYLDLHPRAIGCSSTRFELVKNPSKILREVL